MASSSALTAASGEEENKEQRPTDVMFLCDEWKSSKGGISTFNREFAINLAETTTGSMKIHCYVSKSDDQDREDAKQHGVNLITARSVPGSSDPFERLKFPPSELPNPQLVIGHGRKLGIPAYFLVKSTKCKWIQFVHVYCEDVGKYKKTTMAATDTIEENEKKHKEEIDLCKVADAVVAVGSRLQQKYGRSLLNVKVEIITPGIVGKFFNESKLAVDRSVVKNFNVFMFGRATYEDRSLKGYDIIAKAIDSLGKNFDLTFVGSSPGEYEEVEQWFLDNSGIKRNQLTIRGYCSEQEELKMMFFQADLVAQPSRTEGFGLVSLEAISAGIPVLVSGQSGIAEALQKVEGGNAVIVGSDEDAYEWAQRIREISEQSVEEREANALKLRENYGKLYSWREECEKFKGMIERVMKNNQKLNIKVDVEQLKLADHDACSTASVSAVEPAGCQKASTTSGICRKRRFDAEKEDFQSLEKKVLCLIAMNYLNTTPPQSRDEHNEFREYLQEMKVLISSVSMGSLLITVKCDSLESLEELWEDYLCGLLDKMVRDCFVTEKILKELNLAELKLKTTMDVEEYNACKLYFKKDALRGTSPLTVIPTTGHGKQLKEPTGRIGTSLSTMLPTAGHGKELEGRLKTMKLQEEKRILSLPGPSTFDPEEELEELCRVLQLGEDTSPSTVLSTSGHKKGLRKTEKVRHKIVKPQGKKGMLPLHGTSTHNPEKGVEELGSLPSPPLSTTDLEEKLEEVCVKLKRLRMEGSLPAHQSSTSHVEVKLAELQMELKRLRMEGTRPPPELFTDLLERELEKLRVQITRKRQKGSSPLPDCTLDEEIREILEKLQQKRIEELENTMYPTIISGLAKFDVSLPEELQSYSSYLLNESAKLGLRRKVSQRPSAVQKLREAMDKYELKTFLTIHIREGAWQVVLLFTDELRSRKLPSDWCETKWDWHEKMLISSIYSSASGILKAWPTECDPDLVTLCKAITNRDWKVTRLFFSRCRLSNEGLKNLSTALVQGELYSLAMYDNALQAQGLKHLCEALMRSDSNLISLSIIRNWLGVEGIMHLCHVLTSVNCKLTSLNVCRNLFGSEGLKHLCDALISANCTLTSLNLRYNKLGNEGIKPLFTILTSSNCTLTSLDVSFNRLGDRVLKDLAKTLTNTDCTLTSLVIRSNLIGDEGIKYLCKALTDVKCKLRSLDLQENRKVTDVGKQCLSEAITGTDWKVRRGLKLSRTTNSEA
ncbi:uncharacterized protein LOC111345328 isoform X2 [Stylophora pistillata]|uniref:uncharacterized protein LOC111345328 isoform X2 n=1 Tax=Stylophora pistillata TaxID=50429 RepID=UPI000C04630A|nr:uncharacterized protein LOC111345328 isoform X2 [Stylophora pistillata]